MALGAADGEATENKQSNVEQKEAGDTKDESSRSQRGVYGSLGDYGHSSHGYGNHGYGGHGRSSHDFGGQDFGGHDFGGHDFGASDHHHEHVKTIHIEKKVPVPYTVHKHIPYTVEKKVPYEVKVYNCNLIMSCPKSSVKLY